jgi:glycogen debranching enzyme
VSVPANSWSYEGGPPVSAGGGDVTLVEGVTFCISDPAGDIHPAGEHGLYFRDTRSVSRLELELDGVPAEPLSVRHLAPYGAAFVARRVPRPGRADSALLVVRRRYVGAGLVEEITIRNFGQEAAALVLTVRVDADLAGLFDVKEGRATNREPVEVEELADGVRFSRQSAHESRGTTLSATGAPAVSDSELAWAVVVPPQGEWTCSLRAVPSSDGVEATLRYQIGAPVEASAPATALAAWRRAAPIVTSRDASLAALFARSVDDVGSLRIFDPNAPTRSAVAAGAPWFMTLFGRDSLLASWMLLPIDPGLALGTLHMLGRLQGEKVDPLSEEEPGRILHEVRGGLDAISALGGGGIYYGSIDATPLYVMLLGEARRWGVDWPEIEQLLPHADRALDWIERYGDRDGDGLVEYQRATDRGLANQGWKDSFDGITFRSGQLATPPVALAEVQGYVYAAYLSRAALAREAGDGDLARDMDARAARIESKFDELFWLDDRGHYALGLDAEKRPIDSLASNIGHLLWTGIARPERAARTAEVLLSREMFTGFGIRTLATTMGAYNPMSYHNGSVWPHDNAIITSGLMRYGFVREAQRVAEAIFDAARSFGGRLPELYCGFDRSEFDEPVPYPTSCYPQAWAAAAPTLLLRALLRLEPDFPSATISCQPAVPDDLLPLRVDRLHLDGDLVSCEIDHHGWRMTGLRSGFRLEPPVAWRDEATGRPPPAVKRGSS